MNVSTLTSQGCWWGLREISMRKCVESWREPCKEYYDLALAFKFSGSKILSVVASPWRNTTSPWLAQILVKLLACVYTLFCTLRWGMPLGLKHGKEFLSPSLPYFLISEIFLVRTHQDAMVTIAIEMIDLERNKSIPILLPTTHVQLLKPNPCWPNNLKWPPSPNILTILCSGT